MAVFTDNFTNSGGSDTDLDTWQSVEQASGSSDWDYLATHANSVANAIITDHLTQRLICGPGNTGSAFGNGFTIARVINADALALGADYLVTGTIKNNNTFEYCGIVARLHATQFSGYAVFINDSAFDFNYRLVRFDNNVPTLIDGVLSGVSLGTAKVATLKVVGDQITWSVNGEFLSTVTDATYASGSPGVFLRTAISDFGAPTSSEVYIDTYSVDTTASGTTLTATTPVITITAPTASTDVNAPLAAGTPVITITAPTASPASPVTLLAGTPVITISAPAVSVRAASRTFPLKRSENTRETQVCHAVPAFDIQVLSDIP